MKMVTPGHKYELLHTEDGGVETLQFNEVQELSPSGSRIDGTYDTEVLEAMVDRAKFLKEKDPSKKQEQLLGVLQNALKLAKELAAEKAAAQKRAEAEAAGEEMVDETPA